MITSLQIVIVAVAVAANALEPPSNFLEGSCSEVEIRPAIASRELLDSLKYISGGAKVNMFGLASALPNYGSMREDEFYYDACFTRNTSSITENSLATIFGFGRPLGTVRVTTRPGIYFEGVPLNPSQSGNTLIDTVTLTDNRSFAFVSNCRTGTDQRGWALLTLLPEVDTRTRKIVEEHAVSLGFKRENFVFIRHDSCRLGFGNPSL